MHGCILYIQFYILFAKGINVNELLSGEKISANVYQQKAEENAVPVEPCRGMAGTCRERG